MKRTSYSTGTPWEPIVGYSRAVRVGSNHPRFRDHGDRREWRGGRPRRSLRPDGASDPKCGGRGQGLGADLTAVVRTRMYVTNIDHWEAIGRAHGEFFGDVRPATSMVEVSRLIDPAMLIEIEADAVLAEYHSE